MGKVISVNQNNAFLAGLNLEIDFIGGTNINKIEQTSSQLTISQTGSSINYSGAYTKDINIATITTPIDSPMALNCVVIGVLNDGNLAVLMLQQTVSNPDIVKKFNIDGTVPNVVLSNAMPKPTVPKGTEFTVTLGSDKLTLEYVGYKGELNYADIIGFKEPCIGVLCTTNADNIYDFLVKG